MKIRIQLDGVVPFMLHAVCARYIQFEVDFLAIPLHSTSNNILLESAVQSVLCAAQAYQIGITEQNVCTRNFIDWMHWIDLIFVLCIPKCTWFDSFFGQWTKMQIQFYGLFHSFDKIIFRFSMLIWAFTYPTFMWTLWNLENQHHLKE